jgi:hypothetical protein
MKLDCRACKRTFEGDTELSIELQLLEHINGTPDDEHRAMSDTSNEIDRILTVASITALEDSGIRAAIYDKCANLSSRLQTIHLYANTHLTFARKACLDAIKECDGKAGVIDVMAGEELKSNLWESLVVVRRKFRR